MQVLAICSVQVPAGRRINFEGLAFASKTILRKNTSDPAICQLSLTSPLNNSKTLEKRSYNPFNPRPAAAWVLAGSAHPTPEFLDSSKTVADIDIKLSVPSPATSWRLPAKFQKKNVEQFLSKWRHSGIMFGDCGSKDGKCLKASRMHRFEVKLNQYMSEDVKLSALQNGYLRFGHIV